ncbi:MAG: hypothetical protein Fur0035_08720 [Anaerolineales bacterium]
MTANRAAFWILFLAFAAALLVICFLLIFALFSRVRPLAANSTPSAAPTLQAELPRPSLPPVSSASASPAASTPTVAPLPSGPGKIVYVCQIFKSSATDQICLMNADGSAQRRLSSDDNAKHFYPSFAPDGKSIVFSSNLAHDGGFDIYEMDLSGNIQRLTQDIGILTAPEISPDGQKIVFTRAEGDATDLWVMNRNGAKPHLLYKNAWDASWSPDGRRILLAAPIAGYAVQLASIRVNGTDFQRLSNLPYIRGRNDWSADGRWIITYAGQPWQRELFLMNADGSDAHQISPPGGNSQGPSFSPDSQSVVFTAYFDHYRDELGCEIYTLRLDGTQLARLTDNDYCDWQPRWGP